MGSFEVIVIDDGSTDGSRELCEHLALPFHFRYQWSEQAGPATARNLGLALAQAPLTLFLNDDSLVFPEALRHHLQAHERLSTEKALVLGHFEQAPEALSQALQAYLESSHEIFAYARMQPQGVYRGEFFYTCNASGPTEVFREQGGFDTSFKEPMGEDTEFGLRLDKAGYRVHYVPEARAIHAHTINFAQLKSRQVTAAKTTVKVFQRHPELIARWGISDNLSQHECRRYLAANRATQQQLEDCIARVSSYDTRTEPGRKALESLAKWVPQANHYWWVQGYLEGFETMGLRRVTELVPRYPDPPRHLAISGVKAPEISVIIPTLNRPKCLQRLMGALAAQDLPPHCFEVLIVDDGSEPHQSPTNAMLKWPFETRLLTQSHSGAARARNLGASAAQGHSLVFLNDDALPAPDLLRRHLHRHQTLEEPSIVMGRFALDPSISQDPLQKTLQGVGFLFTHHRLLTGCRYPGLQLCTANASMPTSLFEQVGGFDTNIPGAGGEDSELGYRVQKDLGVQILYDGAISAWHTSHPSISEFLERQTHLGWVVGYMVKKHDDSSILSSEFGPKFDEELIACLQHRIALQQKDYMQLLQWIGHCHQLSDASELASLGRSELIGLLHHLGHHAFCVGVLGANELEWQVNRVA